jgi:hypothetical protein
LNQFLMMTKALNSGLVAVPVIGRRSRPPLKTPLATGGPK